MDKLQAMALFVRVVETGGITRAAESLRIPKATATTLIQKLEASLGVKLLNRTTRRVSVTPDGAAYYTRAVAILAEVREAEEALSQHSTAPRGRVRVDVADTDRPLGDRPGVAALLRPISGDRAGARLQRAAFRPGGRRDRLRAVDRRDRRCEPRRAARGLSLLRHLRGPGLHRRARPADSSARARATSLHQSLLAPHRRDGGVGFLQGGERVQAVFPGHLALEDENSYVSAAEAGLGIAQMPAFAVKEAMERGALDLVLGDWFPEPSPLHVVYPQSRHLSRRVRVFVDWLAALIARSRRHPAAIHAAAQRDASRGMSLSGRSPPASPWSCRTGSCAAIQAWGAQPASARHSRVRLGKVAGQLAVWAASWARNWCW